MIPDTEGADTMPLWTTDEVGAYSISAAPVSMTYLQPHNTTLMHMDAYPGAGRWVSMKASGNTVPCYI